MYIKKIHQKRAIRKTTKTKIQKKKNTPQNPHGTANVEVEVYKGNEN